MRIVVTAPTGNIGSRLSRSLLDAGAEVIVLARHPEKVKDLAVHGAQVCAGDLSNLSFVAESCVGANALFWLTPPNPHLEDLHAEQGGLGRVAAGAVRASRVQRVVNLSSVGAQLEEGTGPILGLRAVEALLDASPAAVTHLRPAFFMENFLFHLETINSMGSIFLPVDGSVSIPMVATQDIAMIAAKRLLDNGWSGRSVQGIHGPRDYSFDECADIISEVLGKPVKHVRVSPDQAREGMMGMGISSGTADLYIEMYDAINRGTLVVSEPRSDTTTTPTEFKDFVAATLVPALA
ncbi:MAG: NmrA family NAD(P)-binding protein [Candidatus Eisenbacteria bacterium]|uniref:NmrA family NAD(P)-binding protein n=1 Tax=Eiseniibacteriota bacterium TaxID=2212470 RepID=A0A7Y2E9H2_UNCEI|nr:NmrA family NAD(P)-binding protein [Candidatus Eisenbacteria bacterium]